LQVETKNIVVDILRCVTMAF